MDTTASWHGGRLQLTVSGADVDRSGEFAVRARGTKLEWPVPSTTTVRSDEAGDRIELEGWLDPRTVAGGQPLDADVWDVLYRLNDRAEDVPAPASMPDTALVDGVKIVPYPTKAHRLALDTADQVVTLVGSAVPRLANATVETAADGTPVTRIALPNTHVAGQTVLEGSLAIGGRAIPAQIVGTDRAATLVVETGRIATARSMRATFGGRSSAPLFARELAALAALRGVREPTEPEHLYAVPQYLPPAVDRLMTPSDRVRLSLARTGDFAALATFNRAEATLAFTARSTAVAWLAGRLRITVRGVLTEHEGTPVRFRRDGDAVVRVLPDTIGGSDPVDVRADLAWAEGAVTLRAREANADYSLPTAVQLELVPGRRATMHVQFTVEAWLDPGTVARSGPIGADVWDVSYRISRSSWTTTRAPVPAPQLDQPTALVDGVRFVLYPTQRDTLAIDTGDKIRTVAGYALPRLADATVESSSHGGTITRIALPGTYSAGETELSGTLTVDEREVPARLIGSGGQATLVVETGRLERAEAVSATFGGRESFPLFAFELTAGRGRLTRLAIAPVPAARRLRERVRRVRPNR